MPSLSARSLGLLLDAWRDESAPSAPPAYVALAGRIRLLILDGRIPLGTRIPAERDLAGQLGISRTTVTAAYAELRAAEYLSSVRGSGSVARLPGPVSRFPDAAAPGILPESELLDFTKATLPAIPAVAEAAVEAARELPGYLGLSGFDPIGLPVLREAIAARYRTRGLPTEAGEIMVTIGAQHAIALVARVLLSRGDRALVESPSYPHAMEALRDAGGRLAGVNVATGEGWDEGALEQVIQRTSPTLGYLMPDFHNPTGELMPDQLREKLARLAETADTTLVIDETMAELAIDTLRHPAPFGIHSPGVISIGSLGKSVWGGLRIGWIRAERPMIERLVRGRNSGDLGTPVLEQLIAARLLADYDAILAARRIQLRNGRDHLRAALAARMPEWRIPNPPGGLTLWVNLGGPVSSQLTLAARTEGLVLAAGPRFGIDGAFERFLRIPFSLPSDELDRATDALARAWQTIGRYAAPERDYLAAVV